MTDKQMKNRFLRQRYLDAWEHYERSLRDENDIKWDYFILTASNEAQAEAYERQIRYRLENGLLPTSTTYAVLPDPDGKRIGSGGATLNVLRYLAEQSGGGSADFQNKRILVIHSGGDSKRVPQYSAVGKLFSPVPRELPNGLGSTLFDEFVIAMSGVPARIRAGMLVLSGDVLLLFDPFQIDFQNQCAAALSIKEPVSTGKNHGVFLCDGSGYVEAFLHKQPEEVLRRKGAVNGKGDVNLDTGAVILGPPVMNALFSLVSTDGCLDSEKFREFVDEETPLSFYGDFLYPLAKTSALEQYLEEAAEGAITEKLLARRIRIWEALSGFEMKLLCLAPAAFIHFGTTWELRKLMTEDVADYEFLDWSRHVVTAGKGAYTAHIADIGPQAKVEAGAYLEYCHVLDKAYVQTGAMVSNVILKNAHVESNVVLHGLPLQDGTFVVRIYGVMDNPKADHDSGIEFLGTDLRSFLERNGLTGDDLWESDERYLWLAKLYPVCESPEEALRMALVVQKMALGTATKEEISEWKKSRRESLHSSFNLADVHAVCCWQRKLEQQVRCRRFINRLEANAYYEDALQVFGRQGISEPIYDMLLKMGQELPVGLKMRLFYAVSRFMRNNRAKFYGQGYEVPEAICFDTLREAVFGETVKQIPDRSNCRIQRDHVEIELPVRVNWGGGWTDTPPYCVEHGGMVLNAALKLNGGYPVRVEVKRLDEYRVEFESVDTGVCGAAATVAEILNCRNSHDPLALPKAALIATGLIPMEEKADLQQILMDLGGGIRISTRIQEIPMGSGLGTSSILAGACLQGIYEFLGAPYTIHTISSGVLGMEQLIATGGGWQDLIGGLVCGIKLITTGPGIEQEATVEILSVHPEVMEELQKRFALIYTGQQRLAQALLRKVVGNYLGNCRESLEALEQMRPLTLQMKKELEQGRIDAFAALLNRHWELSLKLDPAATNACIEQIFLACEDLIDGRFVCGAGGGGFLQVIMKRGITHRQLRERLIGMFPDGGVDVWAAEFA